MPLILIVDDEMYQRTLMRETLSIDGTLDFEEAENGRDGWEMAQQVNPDVILLDVMMPLMNGFEVCKRIKNHAKLKAVPVILVTALGRLDDKVQGLDAGADDFLNKPFEEAELQARVRSALRTKALHDELEAMQLMRESLVRMLMHDMGNMVSVIGSALTVYQRVPPASPAAVQFVQDAYDANLMLHDLINDALDLSRLEAQKMPIKRENTDIVALLQSFVDRFQGAAIDNNVRLELEVESSQNPNANIDRGLLGRVIGNLLTNALKYAPSDSRIALSYGAGRSNGNFRITISDEGPGIPLEDQATIFDKYAQAKKHDTHQARPGRGLGLTFSRMAVEAHNGKIWVESEPGHGTTFIVEIPCEC